MYVCNILLKVIKVQFIMNLRLAPVLVAIGLVFSVLPGRAQLAYTNMTAPTEDAANVASEDDHKAATYKVVHGVVQDKQGVLAGATVWLHGTHDIVVTNAEGEFELRIPANAKNVQLTCSYGGLQDEVVSLAPVQALGSIYLLRTKTTKPSE